MAIPNNSDPKQQLLTALNALYRTNLSLSQVEFGTPDLVAPDVLDIFDPTLRNSKVEINSATGEPYEFTTVLHFNRLALATLFERRDTAFAGAITHTHDLLAELTARVGFPVTEHDIAGHPINTDAGYPLNLLLTAQPYSLLLYGQVEITLTGP